MRRRFASLPILLCWMALGRAIAVRGESAAPVSVLEELVAQGGARVVRSSEGVVIDATNASGKPTLAMATGKTQFTTPVVITAEVKIDTCDARLAFGKGTVIFSDFGHGDELLYRDPATGKLYYRKQGGQIELHQWHTIQYTITEKQFSATVDGANRITNRGDYSGITSTPAIGTLTNSRMTVRSLTVQQGAPSTPPVTQPVAPSGNGSPPVSGGSLAIATSIARPASIDSGSSTPEPAIDAEAIEQPAYRKRAKQLVKDLASINGLVVSVQSDGSEIGSTLDFIAVVPGDSRQTAGSKVVFVRGGQGAEMQTSFDEATRAVKLRFPWWADGRIEVSFDDKYTRKDGGSGGCTFGVLLLSVLQGFEIDPAYAMTGDISVDWKVQPVGAVPFKILGAVAGGCQYVGVPQGNAAEVNDLRLLKGDGVLGSVQIFSLATLQDAVAVARKDRAAPLLQAMKMFADLGPSLQKATRTGLKAPETHQALEKVLQLAPNHLSAKYLLEVADGTAPGTLSVRESVDQIQLIRHPYVQLLSSNEKITRLNLPAVVTASSLKKINMLRPICDKRYIPFLTEYTRYVAFIDDIAAGRATAAAVKERTEGIAAQFAALDGQ